VGLEFSLVYPDRGTRRTVLPTGYTAIDWAGLKGGETVAVFGCGPVGLMAQKVAQLKGAGKVIGLDRQNYRLEAAKRTASSETINIEEGDPVAKIRETTNGRGADVCVDAVGLEAEKSLPDKIRGLLHLQSGSIAAFRLAVDAVRRGGTVSVVGVYGSTYDKFPLGQIFDKGVSLRFGQAPVQKYIDDLSIWSRLVRSGLMISSPIGSASTTHRTATRFSRISRKIASKWF
jgi:S-(hydroxymethyl)glutathione dehydrogenase / alcohol dehydrogenase